jgi:hypothetical protein
MKLLLCKIYETEITDAVLFMKEIFDIKEAIQNALHRHPR